MLRYVRRSATARSSGGPNCMQAGRTISDKPRKRKLALRYLHIIDYPLWSNILVESLLMSAHQHAVADAITHFLDQRSALRKFLATDFNPKMILDTSLHVDLLCLPAFHCKD